MGMAPITSYGSLEKPMGERWDKLHRAAGRDIKRRMFDAVPRTRQAIRDAENTLARSRELLRRPIYPF